MDLSPQTVARTATPMLARFRSHDPGPFPRRQCAEQFREPPRQRPRPAITTFMFVVFFSGLATLDVELFDAADMDGASSWRKLWDLTLPLMRPIIIVAVLIRTLDALKAFDIIYTLTGGAPGSSTETVSFFIYRTGYQFFRLGYGAAASFVFLVALSILLTYLLRFLRGYLR